MTFWNLKVVHDWNERVIRMIEVFSPNRSNKPTENTAWRQKVFIVFFFEVMHIRSHQLYCHSAKGDDIFTLPKLAFSVRKHHSSNYRLNSHSFWWIFMWLNKCGMQLAHNNLCCCWEMQILRYTTPSERRSATSLSLIHFLSSILARQTQSKNMLIKLVGRTSDTFCVEMSHSRLIKRNSVWHCKTAPGHMISTPKIRRFCVLKRCFRSELTIGCFLSAFHCFCSTYRSLKFVFILLK